MKELIVKEVNFNGVNLIGVQKDGKVFVAIKKICDDLGLSDHKKQIARIKRDETLSEGGAVLLLPTNGGNQEVFCLENNYLPFWLTGISSNHCKEEIRPRLKEFKLKAKDILAAAFLNKEPEQKPMSPAELALLQAQNVLAIEKKLTIIESKVDTLISDKNKALEQLKIIELPKVLPLQKSERSALNQLVRNYSKSINVDISEAWNHLYDEFLYIYHIDLKQCAINRNISNLDYIESIAKMSELYSVAYELFITNKKSASN